MGDFPRVSQGTPAGIQAGVNGASDGALTRNSATSITIAAGSGWVKLASGILSPVSWLATTLTVRVPATTALDQVIVDKNGNVSIMQGSVAAGRTLDNRTGADDSTNLAGTLRLHDLLPNATAVGIGTADFRDRRTFATGIDYRNYPGGNPTAFSTGGLTYWQQRIELSGAPLRVRFRSYEIGPSSPIYNMNNYIRGSFFGATAVVLDSLGWGTGSFQANNTRNVFTWANTVTSAGQGFWDLIEAQFPTPVAGSYLFTWFMQTDAGVGNIYGQTAAPYGAEIRMKEIIGNADNQTGNGAT